MFKEESSVSDEETPYRPTIPQLQSGFTSDDGMYKPMYSEYEERSVSCRPHRGGKGRRGRQAVSRERSQSRARSSGSRRQGRCQH